jgi:hypothetical protein
MVGAPPMAPYLIWRARKGIHSSGHCRKRHEPFAMYGSTIVVSAGDAAPRWEHFYVLLHELAHAIAPNDSHHDATFWRIAWELIYEWKDELGIPIREAAVMAERYRKGSRTALRDVQRARREVRP